MERVPHHEQQGQVRLLLHQAAPVQTADGDGRQPALPVHPGAAGRGPGSGPQPRGDQGAGLLVPQVGAGAAGCPVGAPGEDAGRPRERAGQDSPERAGARGGEGAHPLGPVAAGQHDPEHQGAARCVHRGVCVCVCMCVCVCVCVSVCVCVCVDIQE